MLSLFVGFVVGLDVVRARTTGAVDVWSTCAAVGIAGYLTVQGLEQARRSFADLLFLSESVFQAIQTACIVVFVASVTWAPDGRSFPLLLGLQMLASVGFMACVAARVAPRVRLAIQGHAGTGMRDGRDPGEV